jgi:tetratricopeptide (TPR) repeat protein
LINTERITNWLAQPHQLQEVSAKAILQLAKEYPYFTPVHYMKHIVARQDMDALNTLKQLYPVNPVLLDTLLREAAEPVLVTEAIVIEAGTGEEKLAIEVIEELHFQPASADDYFRQQGIPVSHDLPVAGVVVNEAKEINTEKEKSLMRMMSFAEWLNYMSSNTQKAKEEEAEQKALKTMWQKQKLAAAIEEESDEIPEAVFEMAVNSISRKDELVSESLAEVYVKQGKKEKAIEMYQKLSLLNPEKNVYFAAKIENLQKDLEI